MKTQDYLHFLEGGEPDPLRFVALPPSARSVFTAVRDAGPLTHPQLRERTGLPPRTIRFAVRRLQDEGFLEARCSLQDCRTCTFFVTHRCHGLGGLPMAPPQASAAARLAAPGPLPRPAQPVSTPLPSHPA